LSCATKFDSKSKTNDMPDSEIPKISGTYVLPYGVIKRTCSNPWESDVIRCVDEMLYTISPAPE
jgi:hypothetical protein